MHTYFRQADGLRFYIDWAVEQGFGVIDVNIPKHHTGLEVRTIGFSREMSSQLTPHSRARLAQKIGGPVSL